MDPTKLARQSLPKLYLVLAITLGLCYVTSFGGFFEQMESLRKLAPVVRVRTFSVITLFLSVIVALLCFIATLKAIPCGRRWIDWATKAFNIATFSALGVMLVLMATSTFLQNHYMPRLGYSRCDSLQGNPTIWFSDWVRSPGFCMAGKTPEWVNAWQEVPPNGNAP